MTDTPKLVAEYVENGSDAAFRELVTRYVSLVYSTALRLVNGDTHRAEDVVQTVFVDLARMARTLPQEVMLGGWLHQHTCFVAANLMRGERRRQLRERQAVEMNALQENSDFNFSSIAPVVDEAINKLDGQDRTAILLRFFEQHDFRSIGEAIGGSEDSARMRVNRALEKLELLLKRQGVTSTAAALSASLSANAVQAAPAGMAASVSSFALSAATTAPAATATVTAAAKAVTMTTMQKVIVTGVLAVGVGTAIFEAGKAADIRTEIKTLQQHQGTLTLQIQELERERDLVTNQLVGALAENARLESSPEQIELLKLRGEVTRLRAIRQLRQNDPTAAAAKSWLDRVNQLKTYLDQHPDKTIPEFQFLSLARWLNAVETGGLAMKDFKNQDDYYRGQVDFLRVMSEADFGAKIEIALRKYADANRGQFPADLAQLRPYCDSNVADILQQLYEIKPAGILPAEQVKATNVKTDWVIMRKKPAALWATEQRVAYFIGGSVAWPAPSGRDNQ